MPDRFYLDPESTRRSAQSAHDHAGALNDAFSRLTSTLDEHDGCWGTDDIGKNFSEGYVANAKQTRDDTKTTIDGVNAWSDGLNSAVDGFTHLDGQNADDVDHSMADQLKNPPPSS